MRANHFTAALFTVFLATSSFAITSASADTETVVEKNASIIVNGWKLKGDTIIRRSDGLVKVIGEAHASHDGYRCSGVAGKIVLNTAEDRILFVGAPRVQLDGATHVAKGSTGLSFDYRRHTITATVE